MEQFQTELEKFKKRNSYLCVIFLCLIFVPIIMTAIIMPYLPETVPMHYGFDFTVDRYGNKSELWLIGGLYSGLGIFFFILNFIIITLRKHSKTPSLWELSTYNTSDDSEKSEAEDSEEIKSINSCLKHEKVTFYSYICYIVTMIIFTIITATSLYTSL